MIAEGQCHATEGRANAPRVTITLSPTDFLRLIAGTASAPMLFMTGKIKIKGDLAFAAGLMSLFDLPRAE
ncbi:MAG: SCP2 sterol-binding domain-containing protein [Sciscionella sp.]